MKKEIKKGEIEPTPKSVKIIIAISIIICGLILIACRIMWTGESSDQPADQIIDQPVVQPIPEEITPAIDCPGDSPVIENDRFSLRPEITPEQEPLKILYHCYACNRNMETTHRIDVDGEHFTDICDECLIYFERMISEASHD